MTLSTSGVVGRGEVRGQLPPAVILGGRGSWALLSFVYPAATPTWALVRFSERHVT